MARLGRRGFLAVAVVFHLIYVYSVFDIYFVSPIVSGMREFSVQAPEPPAQRLVLIVGDGLRADKAFQSFPDPSAESNDAASHEPRPLAPFLRSRVLSHGTFGVSHTRVPTESRPGHVALIAGLYEDVSAITTGWKLNPVNFDSVFNRSRHTWSWGSPDILPMFKEGAVPGRVDVDMYGAEAEDFTQDATQLDTWVFDRVKEFFRGAEMNATLDAMLRQDRNVFFLHLLGLDTSGHAYRPYSREYLHNIKVVDQGVQEVTQLIESYYGDGKTAFVFTADHGMSDWGSHGDGNPDNTRTPLVAWGSGVARPVVSSGGRAPGHEDGFSSDWGLDHVRRHDVAQADVAALMAYLAGLAFPVNSVGQLPLGYLQADPKAQAEALLVNAREIAEMYRVKEEDKRAKKIKYNAFRGLSGKELSSDNRISRIRDLIDNGEYEIATTECEALIELSLQGLRYLQTYDWLFLRTLVTAGYLGWMLFAITTIVDVHVLDQKTDVSRTLSSLVVFPSILVGLFSLLYTEKAPWTYYAYAVFPVFFWEECFARREALIKGKNILLEQVKGKRQLWLLGAEVMAFVALLEALVFSYNYRTVYTVCYMLAAAWPAFYGTGFLKSNKLLAGTWAISCLVMSVFTLLPVIKVESLGSVLLAGFLMFGTGVLYLGFEDKILMSSDLPPPSAGSDGVSRAIMGIQVGLIGLAMFVTRSSVKSLQARHGLPLGTQIVGWSVLVASFAVPFLHGLRPNAHYLHRLMVMFLAFAPSFIVLTISYEGFFYFAFFMTLVTWVQLEHRIYAHCKSQAKPDANGNATVSKDSNPLKPALASAHERTEAIRKGDFRALTLADARISLFFFFLLQSAFFSTGNMASVSSFSLDAVYRLIPVFDPYSQGALLMLKILIPFAAVTANLGILNRRLGVAPSALFMIVMAVGDVMTLNFFYMVRDEGSWLDIGTTISHFCIASGLCVFVAGLESLSQVFVSGIRFGEEGLGVLVEEKSKMVSMSGDGKMEAKDVASS